MGRVHVQQADLNTLQLKKNKKVLKKRKLDNLKKAAAQKEAAGDDAQSGKKLKTD